MHEAGIAESIVKVALGALPRPGLAIRKILVAAGALSGVEEAPLRTWLEHIARRTPAEGAELVFRRVPAGLTCSACGRRDEYDGSAPLAPKCPRCGGTVQMDRDDSGRCAATDFYVESIEVEEP